MDPKKRYRRGVIQEHFTIYALFPIFSPDKIYYLNRFLLGSDPMMMVLLHFLSQATISDCNHHHPHNCPIIPFSCHLLERPCRHRPGDSVGSFHITTSTTFIINGFSSLQKKAKTGWQSEVKRSNLDVFPTFSSLYNDILGSITSDDSESSGESGDF